MKGVISFLGELVKSMPKPSTLEVWSDQGVLDDNLEAMEGMALLDFTFAEIADAFSISLKTLERMKKEDVRVSHALLRGSRRLAGQAIKERIKIAKRSDCDLELANGIWKDLGDRAEARARSLVNGNGGENGATTVIILDDDSSSDEPAPDEPASEEGVVDG